jgi:hypothetical protein
MASQSHPKRNPNLSVHRLVLPGKLPDPPGAFWGLLRSPGKLLGASLGFSWDRPGSSWSLLEAFLGSPSPCLRVFGCTRGVECGISRQGRCRMHLRASWCTSRFDITYVVGGLVGTYFSQVVAHAKCLDPYYLLINTPAPPRNGGSPPLNCARGAPLVCCWFGVGGAPDS